MSAEARRLSEVAGNMGDFDVWGSRVERSAAFALKAGRLAAVADWCGGNPERPAPLSGDWAHAAARGVRDNLCDRRDIKRGFAGVDGGTRAEVVASTVEIIREADRRSAVA